MKILLLLLPFAAFANTYDVTCQVRDGRAIRPLILHVSNGATSLDAEYRGLRLGTTQMPAGHYLGGYWADLDLRNYSLRAIDGGLTDAFNLEVRQDRGFLRDHGGARLPVRCQE